MLRSVANMLRKAAKGFTLDASPAAVEMFTFSSPQVVDKWHVFTDAFFGGRSQAALVYNAEQQAAEFSGRVTFEQEADADMRRAGYCVASSKVTHIADYWDLSGCGALVLGVRGDGRTYIATLRTDSIAGTGGDIWQAPFRTRPDVWQEVVIPLRSLVLTYQGQLVQRRLEFQANQVISVGVAVSAVPDADAEAQGGITLPDNMPEQQLASSSSSSDAVESTSSTGRQDAAEGSDATSGSSSSSSSSSSSEAVGTGEAGVPEPFDWESFPEHERFRLLIRSIHADVEV